MTSGWLNFLFFKLIWLFDIAHTSHEDLSLLLHIKQGLSNKKNEALVSRTDGVVSVQSWDRRSYPTAIVYMERLVFAKEDTTSSKQFTSCTTITANQSHQPKLKQ